MPYIDQEDIIGWYNKSTNHFLCDECFTKVQDIERKDYEPVEKDEMDFKDLYICDECSERFAQ